MVSTEFWGFWSKSKMRFCTGLYIIPTKTILRTDKMSDYMKRKTRILLTVTY